jgi:hypothetical protein
MKLLASNEGSWSPVMTEPFKPGEGIELPWTVDDRMYQSCQLVPTYYKKLAW